jgi:hypothetical protein
VSSSALAATIPSASRSKKTTTPTRTGRRRDGSYCGRPACPRDGGQATSPDSRHRSQSSRVQHRCPGRARQYRACRPGVLLAGDSARIINPPTGGGLGGNNTAESRTLITWPGSCGSGAPRPDWSRALLDIPITQ